MSGVLVRKVAPGFTVNWLNRLRQETNEKVLGLEGLRCLEAELDRSLGSSVSNGQPRHLNWDGQGLMRLQVTPNRGGKLADLEQEALPILKTLGLHAFTSPWMHSGPHSADGYPVVNPNAPDPDRGGWQETIGFLEGLQARNLKLIIDLSWHALKDKSVFEDPDRRRRFLFEDSSGGHCYAFWDFRHLEKLRLNDPEVANEVHLLARVLVKMGAVHGLRLDAADGAIDLASWLYDLEPLGIGVWPEMYFSTEDQRNGARIPGPAAGNAGHELLFYGRRLIVDESAHQVVAEMERQVSGEARHPGEIAHQERTAVAYSSAFEPEVRRLWQDLGRSEFISHSDIIDALVSASEGNRVFPNLRLGTQSDKDKAVVSQLVQNPVLAQVLRMDWWPINYEGDPVIQAAPGVAAPLSTLRDFIAGFWLTASAVNGKGWVRTVPQSNLLSLNWTMFTPKEPPFGIAEFHAWQAWNLKHYPHKANCLSNHDTIFGLDNGTAMAALRQSPIAERWATIVPKLLKSVESLHGGVVHPADVYHYLQLLAGAASASPHRLFQHLHKMLREAGKRTGWGDQVNEPYEQAVRSLCLRAPGHEPFRQLFNPFMKRFLPLAEQMIVSQLTLLLGGVGMPVIYPFDLMWGPVFVDPDNRSHPNWQELARLTASLEENEPVAHEAAKVHVVKAGMNVRQRHARVFAESYQPIEAPAGWIAFARGDDVQVWVPIRHDVPAAGPGPGWTNALKLSHLGFSHGIYERG